MKYISIDILENECIKHKDWVIDAIMTSKFSHIIKYIVEEETDHFLNNQPERSKREDLLDLDINILDRAIKRAHQEGAWDQEDYDEMHSLVQNYKDAVL